MQIIKAYKTRIYPSSEQIKKIDKTLNCCRFVYNHMLARNNKIYERRKEHLSYYDMQNLLPEMKRYLPWLKEADSQALKYSCRQVNDAFTRFFRKQTGFPRFKKKRGRSSYLTTNTVQIVWEEGRVKLPCLGYVKTKDRRAFPSGAKVCDATISHDTDGRYYVSVCFKYEAEIKKRPACAETTIGLDYNVSKLFVDSDGNSKEFPHWYQDSLKKLAMEQRKLSRMQGSKKGEKKSGRYLKQQKKVNKLQKHISQQRQDFLHKQSTAIAKLYSVICIEDLSVKDMIQAAEKLGGKKKRRARRAYMNNGWNMFTQMLDYKEKYSGGEVVKVNKYYRSSQSCSICGHVEKGVKNLSVRSWVCPKCGTAHDRDENAAINIKKEGLKMLEAS